MDRFECLQQELARRCPDLEVRAGEPMSRHTSFRIGGPARLMALPKSPAQAKAAVLAAREADIVPFFLAYLVLDVTLRYTYRGAGLVGVRYLPACLFTLGWALLLAGLVFVLPKVPRWFVRCVPLVTCVVLAVTHSGFMSMFGRFFSFSVLSFGGTSRRPSGLGRQT